MENIGLILFGLFLLALVILDVSMIVSLLKGGDERRQLIVWKASTFTLVVVVGSLVLDIVESVIRVEAMRVNSFVKLSVTAMVYLAALLYYKRRYGD